MLTVWSRLGVMLARVFLSKVAHKVDESTAPVVDAVLDEVQNELFSPSFPRGISGELSRSQDPKPLGGTDEKPAADTQKPSG